jgi:hypothetical protein
MLQGASNAVASNVSGPVDLLSMGLRKLGVPVPQNALGGSQWMAERGLTAPVRQGPADVIGQTLGMVSPMAAAARAPQIANALNVAQANAAIPRHMNPQRGAVVWHGSPHKFDAFDPTKIGSGEGAQAYGHGLYLAESKNVADEYAGKLSKKMIDIPGFDAADEVSKAIIDRLSARANTTRYGGGAQAALDDLHSIARFGSQQEKAVAEQMLKTMGPFGMPKVTDAGNLYKVDLPDEKIARMLDWDAPLSQQASEVRDSVAPMLERMRSEAMAPAPGWGDLQGAAPDVDALLRQLLKGGPETAAELRKRGIPGIRYLDGGSRGAGSGTRNFVVFPGEENALRILERNGAPLR